MKLATWNLQRPGSTASAKSTALLDRMRAVDADIWVLTETRESMSPGESYAKVATVDSDRKQTVGEQWTMIWSRLPILGTEPTSDPIRTVCVRVDTGAFGNMLVYGTVLPWRTDARWLPLRGGKAFRQALQSQEQDWQRLRQKYPHDLLCVAGDFNQELGNRTQAGTALGRTELRRSLQNVSLACVTGDEDDPVAKTTSDQRRNIDHICLDARLSESTKVECVAWPHTVGELKGLSDHFGVWVEVSTTR